MELDKLLETFRDQIDTIDNEIIYLLSRRLQLVEQVGKVKKEVGGEALQPKRWGKVLNNLYEEADDKNINKDLVKNIWEEIHKESLKIEKSI